MRAPARRWSASAALLIAAGCGGSAPPAPAPVADAPPADASSSRPGQRRSLLPAPLGAVPVRLAGAVDFDAAVVYTLQTRKPRAAAEMLRRRYAEVQVGEQGIVLRVGPRAIVRKPSGERDRASSFFVDFEEPDVVALSRQVAARHGEAPRPEQMTDFVRQHFHKARFGSFDVASEAARKRAGDCTEHAVLLAALMRSFGVPARVVLGYLVEPAHQLALGHAWVEAELDGAWHAFDATRERAANGAHLGVATLEDEGPGIAVEVTQILAAVDILSLEISPGRRP